jgi:hypothetical protein
MTTKYTLLFACRAYLLQKPYLIMVEVSAWTSSLALFFLIYYSFGTLRGVHLSVGPSSRYVIPLQKDENPKGSVYRWHGSTPLRALG